MTVPDDRTKTVTNANGPLRLYCLFASGGDSLASLVFAAAVQMHSQFFTDLYIFAAPVLPPPGRVNDDRPSRPPQRQSQEPALRRSAARARRRHPVQRRG